MSDFKIEHGVPVPNNHLGAPIKYPWRELEVGDSFFVSDKKAHLMSTMASAAGKKFGLKFTTRAVDGGVRVWRTA